MTRFVAFARRSSSLLVLAFVILASGCGKEEASTLAKAAPKKEQASSKKGTNGGEKTNGGENGNIGEKANAGEKTKAEKAKEVANAVPEAKLSSKEFGEEFRKNRQAALKKYQDKNVELKGTIRRMNFNVARQTVLVLEGARDDNNGVQCIPVESEPWKKYMPSQQITVRGKVDKDSAAPLLNSCTVVEAGEQKIMTVTSKKLAEEFSKDEDKAEGKYIDKHLLVTGEIIGLNIDKTLKVDSPSYLELKGDGKRKIWCHFFLKGEMLEPLKIGDKVQIQGECQKVANDKITLRNCFVFGPAK
jgi:hypothetical protein